MQLLVTSYSPSPLYLVWPIAGKLTLFSFFTFMFVFLSTPLHVLFIYVAFRTATEVNSSASVLKDYRFLQVDFDQHRLHRTVL